MHRPVLTLPLPHPPLARASFIVRLISGCYINLSQGLVNKKKVNSSDGNSSSSNNNISDISNGNGNINKNGNTHGTKIHSDNGKLHNSKETDIDDNVEYIGQCVLAGPENNSEMGLAVD